MPRSDITHMMHVRGLGHQRNEIPERVVGGRRLRHREVRLRLRRVDQIGKLDCILNEEHRDVVADEVPVAFVGVELHREAANVARGVGGAAFADDGREPDEHRRALARFGEYRGAGDIGERLVAFEVSVRARAARMHDALGYPLVIEMRDLLAEDEVLQQCGAAQVRLSASSGCR